MFHTDCTIRSSHLLCALIYAHTHTHTLNTLTHTLACCIVQKLSLIYPWLLCSIGKIKTVSVSVSCSLSLSLSHTPTHMFSLLFIRTLLHSRTAVEIPFHLLEPVKVMSIWSQRCNIINSSSSCTFPPFSSLHTTIQNSLHDFPFTLQTSFSTISFYTSL